MKDIENFFRKNHYFFTFYDSNIINVVRKREIFTIEIRVSKQGNTYNIKFRMTNFETPIIIHSYDNIKERNVIRCLVIIEHKVDDFVRGFLTLCGKFKIDDEVIDYD